MIGRHFRYQLVPAGCWRRLTEQNYGGPRSEQPRVHLVPTDEIGRAYVLFRKSASEGGSKVPGAGVPGVYRDGENNVFALRLANDSTDDVTSAINMADRDAEALRQGGSGDSSATSTGLWDHTIS